MLQGQQGLSTTAPTPTAMNSALFQPPQGDPYEALNLVLNNLSQQPLPQPPKQGAFGQIAEGIAQAAAVLASPDSGAALQKQLQTKQEGRRFQQEQEIARQNLINQVKLQASFQQATDLGKEQMKVREENRGERRRLAEAQTELDIYGKKKGIDLKTAEQEFRTNQKLLEEFQPQILARAKDAAIIADWPQQRKDALDAEAMIRTVLPNLDPLTATRIADKVSRLNTKDPLTPEEIDIWKKVNQETSKIFKTERETKLAKTRAETTRELAEAAYTRAGKPGSAGMSPMERFNSSFGSTMGGRLASRVASSYYRVVDTGEILTEAEYRGLDMVSDIRKRPGKAVALTEEENKIQRAIEAGKLAEFQNFVQQGQEAQAPQTSIGGAGRMSDDAVQQAVKALSGRGDTPEQIRRALQVNGATPEQIGKFVPQGSPARPSPTATPAIRPREVQPATPEQQKMLDELLIKAKTPRRK